MPMPLRSSAVFLPPDHPGSAPAPEAESFEDRLNTRILELESELRELQHRAKNSLQMVISLLKLQAGRIRDPDARAAYEQTMLRIETLAILYRQLHETGSGTHVDLGRYVETLCDAVKGNAQGGTARIPVSITSDPIQIGLYEAMPLGLIIAELLTNSLHHAYPDDGWIRVSVRQEPNGRARLTVEDNGRALPAGFDTTAEDGLMLAEALAGQLGDTLSTDSDAAGTTAGVSFPI
ncbi:sensor histidine kinase [Azospirillum doebereinerae]|uniref:histidine kinase n=1 Tax=Azospirillum doebereinerae TaxID=92933 RepID=A0A433J9P9_9PROT|nr:histidine kinase dimerization/phosphoacceptor domain -containing protein [Azospirillum doebereinerae]MCG5243894.1 histidine kinase [Azospirillum doebereinerae]RUQ71510.1 histidine kinase [Azospirillum doebereinerae]